MFKYDAKPKEKIDFPVVWLFIFTYLIKGERIFIVFGILLASTITQNTHKHITVLFSNVLTRVLSVNINDDLNFYNIFDFVFVGNIFWSVGTYNNVM